MQLLSRIRLDDTNNKLLYIQGVSFGRTCVDVVVVDQVAQLGRQRAAVRLRWRRVSQNEENISNNDM
jgi:hypothetical protein